MELKELEQIDFKKVHIHDLFRVLITSFACTRITESEFHDVRTSNLMDFAYSVSSCALKDFGVHGEGKDPKEYFNHWVDLVSQSLKSHREECKHPLCEEVY